MLGLTAVGGGGSIQASIEGSHYMEDENFEVKSS